MVEILLENQKHMQDYIAGRTGHSQPANKHDVGFHRDFPDDKVVNSLTKAEKAKFVDDAFTSIKGNRHDISGAIKRLEDAKERLAEYETGKGDTKTYKKYVEDLEKNLRKDAKGYFKDLDEAHKVAEKARTILLKDRDAKIKVADEFLRKETKALNPKAPNYNKAYDAINERHKNVMDAIENTYGKKIENLDEHISTIAEHTGKLEKATGMKAADHIASTAVTSAEKGAVKAAEQAGAKEAGMLSRMGQNLKGGFGAKAKVGLGVIAGGGLALSGFKDLAGRTDDDGKPVESNKFVGLVKVAAGLIGGAKLAAWR
ncbi:MAG: hypothetical protein ACK502_09370 [Alphaproteobacteria bacterium]